MAISINDMCKMAFASNMAFLAFLTQMTHLAFDICNGYIWQYGCQKIHQDLFKQFVMSGFCLKVVGIQP